MAKKAFVGTVSSAKMEKTLVVTAKRQLQEPRTGKIVTVSKKYKVHCEADGIAEGDTVLFTECRLLSKDKKFRFLKVTRKAEQVLA